MAHTEASIQQLLGKNYGIKRGLISMPNVLLMDKGMYEADFIYIGKNNYLTEIEIKISISDFQADFAKKHYHDNPKVRALYYAVPRELWSKHYKTITDLTATVGAGVIVCDDTSYEIERKPKLRKVEPLTIGEVLYYARIGCLKWIKACNNTESR